MCPANQAVLRKRHSQHRQRSPEMRRTHPGRRRAGVSARVSARRRPPAAAAASPCASEASQRGPRVWAPASAPPRPAGSSQVASAAQGMSRQPQAGAHRQTGASWHRPAAPACECWRTLLVSTTTAVCRWRPTAARACLAADLCGRLGGGQAARQAPRARLRRRALLVAPAACRAQASLSAEAKLLSAGCWRAACGKLYHNCQPDRAPLCRHPATPAALGT